MKHRAMAATLALLAAPKGDRLFWQDHFLEWKATHTMYLFLNFRIWVIRIQIWGDHQQHCAKAITNLGRVIRPMRT